jgi:hypothetical protein
LHERNVPFVVYTGYPSMLTSGQWPTVPVIYKPVQPGQIVSTLERVLGLGNDAP